MLCDPQSDLRCAEHPSAFESGIFELLGSCTPLAYFFLLSKKSGSPHAVGTGVANASKATHAEAGYGQLKSKLV